MTAPRRNVRLSDRAASFASYLEETGKQLNLWLDEALPPAKDAPQKLHEALRFAEFPGGKRLRPTLVLLACEAFGGEIARARYAACAVELIHAYSLIHDDLPCMDDGVTRRGKPCVHRAYGEAGAVLAGDALLTHAFDLLSRTNDAGAAKLLVGTLAEAAGSRGMVGGQIEDLEAAGSKPERERVERIHALKTGRLIAASLELGSICAGASDSTRERVRAFGRDVGLVFQIVDDILDVTGTEASLGKGSGQDAAAGKMTYPACLGLGAARTEARSLAKRADERIPRLGAARTERLEALTSFVLERLR